MTNLNDRDSYRRDSANTDGHSERIVRTTEPNQIPHAEHETVRPLTEYTIHPTEANQAVNEEPRYVAGDRDVVSTPDPHQVISTPKPAVRRRLFNQGADRTQYRDDRLVERQQVRDNDNVARGLTIGIVATSLAALVIGSLFALNQRRTPEPVAPVIVPNTAAPQSPQVIERDRLVPAPQQQAPASGGVAVPNSGQGQQAPATQTAPANGTQSGGTSSSVQTPSSSGSASTGSSSAGSAGAGSSSSGLSIGTPSSTGAPASSPTGTGTAGSTGTTGSTTTTTAQ